MRWRYLLTGLILLVVSACSGSNSLDSATLADDPLGSEPTPEVLLKLAASTELIAPVPDVAHTQTMADSGLQIAYTTLQLRSLVPAQAIEQQWIFMQECLELVGVAPLVLVREGPVVPITLADDVVRNENPLALEINSVPVASASTLYGPVIQISASDFDGSLGSHAFGLRSIMGRHLWLSASLPERDYPFACAQLSP